MKEYNIPKENRCLFNVDKKYGFSTLMSILAIVCAIFLHTQWLFWLSSILTVIIIIIWIIAIQKCE